MKVKANLSLLEETQAKALKQLRLLVKNGKNSRSFLQLKAYPAYIGAQMKRWMTENQSQGTQWKPLNPDYAWWKKTRFAFAIGHGTKMMIRTGKLYQSVIGAGEGHFKMITDKEMIVGTDVPYAKYAGAQRTIMSFDKRFIQKLKKSSSSFL